MKDCEYCMEGFDPREENPESNVCQDCLGMGIDIVRAELTERGMTIPGVLEITNG